MKLHLPLSLRKTVLSCLLTAFSITIADGAIEYLQDDFGLQDGNQTREPLMLVNGQQMTLNGNSVDSSLYLSDGTLSLDYGSATAPSSMQGNDLTLSGGTTLHLIPGTTTDGKYINLLTNVGTLYGADGSQLIFSSANNAASQYFDTSQPGSGYWKNATLQLTSDGTLQMQLHNGTVKDALTITARQTGSVNYCYYESISLEDIVYSTSSEAYGGAINGGDYSTITLSNNGSVTFSGNTASGGSSAYGGAIYGYGDITLSNNGSVTFSGNKATSSGWDYVYGGAINGGDYSTITLSNNGSVSFSGNTATSSGWGNDSGGAIYGGDDSTITLSANGSVTFSGNTASGGSYASGGAIYGGFYSTIMLSNNGSVSFSGNTASGGSDASGGAIDGKYDSTITLSNNGSVTFSGNTASGGRYAYGGAIYGGDYSTITLSNNSSVTFDGNTASGEDYVYGGAIYGGDYSTITLSNNSSVTFDGNTASGEDYVYGGAIYTQCDLNIRNNDSVLFEKNAEISNGSYRLRSIYADGSWDADVVSLSAAKGKSIEFRDSVYISSGFTVMFNVNYKDAAGLFHKQEGDIIFTGAYTEKHLNELLTAAEAGRTATAAEIENSRLTFVDAETRLYGGRLRVEDGAIYQGRGITAMAGSGATVRVQEAELHHGGYDLTFNSGTSLELVGDSSLLCSTLMMEEGSTLLLDAFSAIGTCNLIGNLTMNGSMQLLLGETTAAMENAVLMWVSGEVNGWTDSSLTLNSSTGDAHITWVNNHLVLNYNTSTYNQYFNGSIAYSERQFAPLFYHHYEEISFKDIAYSTSSSSVSGGAIYGGADSTITLSANGSVTFSGNTASGEGYAYGGAIYGGADSIITLSANGSVTFSGNTASGGYDTYGGAIYGGDDSTITLSANGSVTFSGNTASGEDYVYGGAIYGGADSTITLSNNSSVTFDGNTASGVSYTYGGAICGRGDITLSNNESVTFSGNSSTSSLSLVYGGAIYGGSYSTITLSDNGSVTFDGNTATASGGSAYGGAIYGAIMLSNNESVTFSGNKAKASSISSAVGGAIYGYGAITLSDNGIVTFSGNTASGYSANGGAIIGSSITLSNNESVIFSENSASGSEAYGGAIIGSSITLSNNGSVTFSGNTATSSGSSAYGGAIRANGNLSIRNNDSVLFEKNAEISNGSYRLRSIYAGGSGDVVSLSAAKGKSIEFRDSVYIASGSTVKLNEDYTDAAGLVHKQEGDIIFTGAYTEKHLNELLTAAEAGRTATAAEIENSRLTLVDAETQLYGGRLRVEAGAIYQGCGITAMAGSGATVRVQDAKLDHSGYGLTFYSGTTLELCGKSILSGDLNLQSSSTLRLLDGSTSHSGNLSVYGGVEINLSGIEFSSGSNRLMILQTDDASITWAPTYTLVRVANLAQTGYEGYVSYGAFEWESGKLYVDVAITNTATWNNATGNGLWDGKSENWAYEGNSLVDIQGIEHVILGETAQGNIRLEGEICVGNIQVKDGCAYILNPAEGAGLQLTGTLSLEGSSSLSVKGDLMAAAVSGDGVLSVQDSLLVSGAVQAESLHVDTLVAGSLKAGSLQASSLTLTDAGADNSVDGVVTVSGDITSAGSLRVGGAMSGNAIEVNGALTAGSLQAGSLQASSLTLTDAVGDGSSIGELVAETLEVREGVVTLGRTSGSTEMSLLDLDLQKDATLVLNQQTRLAVTRELTATEDATVKLHGGAGISYLELSVANRNAAKATIVKAVELAEGKFSVLENAYVGVNSSEDSTIDYQLIDSSVENLGSGTLYITHENNTLSELVAGGGNITVYNQAELNLENLKVAASMTVSAYCGSMENAANEAKINVTEKVSFGAGTTLNADLVIRQGATLEMDGPVNMGSDLYLYSGTLLGENLLTAIRTAEVGTKVDLFAGIDSLYFNGVRQDFSLTLSDGVSAESYFSNLTDEWARAYYLVYDNSIVNEGLLSIEIVGLSVPEPTTATLSLLALAALAARRRRK